MANIASDITSPVSGHRIEPDDHHGSHRGSLMAVRGSLVVVAVLAAGLAYLAYQERGDLRDVRTQLSQANSETVQAKADADASKAQAGSLQTQLDSSQAQSAGFQKQLTAAQEQGAGLQSQLTTDQARLTRDQAAQRDLKSELARTTGQVSDLQSKLGSANDGAADVRRQLEEAKAHAADLQTQLDAAKPQAQAVAVAIRALPLSITTDKGFYIHNRFLTSNRTLFLRNNGTDALTVGIAVDGAPAQPATVQPGTIYDVHGLRAGSKVVVSSDGFEPQDITLK